MGEFTSHSKFVTDVGKLIVTLVLCFVKVVGFFKWTRRPRSVKLEGEGGAMTVVSVGVRRNITSVKKGMVDWIT